MYAFAYHRPASLEEAVELCLGIDDAKLLAGGHTLLPTMKQRLAAPSDLVDLAGIPGLREIRRTAEAIEIGAMARHADVAQNALVRQHLPGLTELAGMIGDPLVRHRGTIGGSIANNDPAADYPAACLALRAEIVTTTRSMPANQFFLGLFETALEPGEIIRAVRFTPSQQTAYAKFKNQASRYAVAGVFVARHAAADVCVAVTGAGENGVFRWHAAEERLAAAFTPDALLGLLPSEPLSDDIHADRGYRGHIVATMARRAVQAAAARAAA